MEIPTKHWTQRFRFLDETKLGIFVLSLIDWMPWSLLSVTASMLAITLTEGVGLLLLLPLLQMSGLDVGESPIGRNAEVLSGAFQAVGIAPTLTIVLVVYLGIVGARGLLSRKHSLLQYDLVHRFGAILRFELYGAITRSRWVFFSREPSSRFIHVLTHEIERTVAATFHLLQFIATLFGAITYILFAIYLSLSTTCVVFACGALLMFVSKRRLREARVAAFQLTDETKQLFAAVVDQISGLKTTKTLGIEEHHARSFSEQASKVRKEYIASMANQVQGKFLFDLSFALTLCLVLYLSLEVLSIPTAELLLMLFLFLRLVPRLSGIQHSYGGLIHLLPAFANIVQTMKDCSSAADPTPLPCETLVLRREICLEDVHFGYSEVPVISGLSLRIRAGQTTAIVGSSGAGKSTIADLITGLVAPDRGRILVDATVLTGSRIASWRKQIGYVAQDVFLFHDTIRNNLLLANPAAREEELRAALEMTFAADFIASLPHQLDTVVGDRGVLLSGGERQRLALARALLRKPSLLILDEATSQLDSVGESHIQRSIEHLRGQCTVLIISHRLASVRHTDSIHVLEDGRVVESGTWSELTNKESGRFQQLFRSQGLDTSSSRPKPDPDSERPLFSEQIVG